MAFFCPIFPKTQKDEDYVDTTFEYHAGTNSLKPLATLFEDEVCVGRQPEIYKPNTRIVLTHDFSPTVDDELAVSKGEVVNALYRENDWLYVLNKAGIEGFVPIAYCRPFVETSDATISKGASLKRRSLRSQQSLDSVSAPVKSSSTKPEGLSKSRSFLSSLLSGTTSKRSQSQQDLSSGFAGRAGESYRKPGPDWFGPPPGAGRPGFIDSDLLPATTKRPPTSSTKPASASLSSATSRTARVDFCQENIARGFYREREVAGNEIVPVAQRAAAAVEVSMPAKTNEKLVPPPKPSRSFTDLGHRPEMPTEMPTSARTNDSSGTSLHTSSGSGGVPPVSGAPGPGLAPQNDPTSANRDVYQAHIGVGTQLVSNSIGGEETSGLQSAADFPQPSRNLLNLSSSKSSDLPSLIIEKPSAKGPETNPEVPDTTRPTFQGNNNSFAAPVRYDFDDLPEQFVPFARVPFGRFIAGFKFVAKYPQDIGVERGEVLLALNRDDPAWIWVRKQSGAEGFVPSSYIFPLELNRDIGQGRVQVAAEIHRQGSTRPSSGYSKLREQSNARGTTFASNQSEDSGNVTPISFSDFTENAFDNPEYFEPPTKTVIASSPVRNAAKFTELLVTEKFVAEVKDDLPVARGDWVYTQQDVGTLRAKEEFWVWVYCPRLRKYGFVPCANVKIPEDDLIE